MREIRFRIWDTKTKRYLEKGHPDFVNAWGFEDCKNRLVLKAKSGSLIFEQYTGLKDKNGKEIYEGDIIRAHLSPISQIIFEGIVEYKPGCIMFKCFADGGSYAFNSLGSVEAVIGNIHENPELLEAGV